MKFSMSEPFQDSNKPSAKTQQDLDAFYGAAFPVEELVDSGSPTTFDDVLIDIQKHNDVFEDVNEDLQVIRKKKNRNKFNTALNDLRNSESNNAPNSRSDQITSSNVQSELINTTKPESKKESVAQEKSSLYERARAGDLGAITAISNLIQDKDLAQDKFTNLIHSEKVGFDQDISVGLGSILSLFRENIFRESYTFSHGGMAIDEKGLAAIRAFLKNGGIACLEDLNELMSLLSELGDVSLPPLLQTEIESSLVRFLKSAMKSLETVEQLNQFIALVSKQILATSLIKNLSAFEDRHDLSAIEEGVANSTDDTALDTQLDKLVNKQVDLLEDVTVSDSDVIRKQSRVAIKQYDERVAQQRREELALKAMSVQKTGLSVDQLNVDSDLPDVAFLKAEVDLSTRMAVSIVDSQLSKPGDNVDYTNSKSINEKDMYKDAYSLPYPHILSSIRRSVELIKQVKPKFPDQL